MPAINSPHVQAWMLWPRPRPRLIARMLITQALFWIAFVWRRLMFRTTFISVSGSVGKTTTKDLLNQMLSRDGRVVATQANCNNVIDLCCTLLRARPWTRYVVIEVAVSTEGGMAPQAFLVRPDVALMLDVKRCHIKRFKTVEAIAGEKAKILQAVRPGGTAIINDDNDLVHAMAEGLQCKVVRFGTDARADFRVVSARSEWPQRLSIELKIDEQNHFVRSQLVGVHWASTVAASLAVARECGMPMARAIQAIESQKPACSRTQPVFHPESGATFIRDEGNGSIDVMEAAFEVMKSAQVSRKIIVVSDCSDSSERSWKRVRQLARDAADAADVVIMVGHYAERATNSIRNLEDRQVTALAAGSVRDAAAMLKAELRKGDLVLIKGQTSQHLERVYLALLGPVSCQVQRCARMAMCDTCPKLGIKWRPELTHLMGAPKLIY